MAESGVTTPRLHQVKTGQKHPQLTLHCSLNALRFLLEHQSTLGISDSISQVLMFNVAYSSELIIPPDY